MLFVFPARFEESKKKNLHVTMRKRKKCVSERDAITNDSRVRAV